MPLLDSGPRCLHDARSNLLLPWISRRNMATFTANMAEKTAGKAEEPCSSHKVRHCAASKRTENAKYRQSSVDGLMDRSCSVRLRAIRTKASSIPRTAAATETRVEMAGFFVHNTNRVN